MRKIKTLLLAVLFVCSIFCNNSFAQNYDFTSNHIEVENDAALTNKLGYPVLRVKNNTNSDLNVTYSFYINETDSYNYDNTFSIKANDTILLEIPQLSHLGSTKGTRTIWFNWSEKNIRKPLQNQIETIPFESKNVAPSVPQFG